MEILWLAIVLYSVGLGLVLHFRPALMFNENGTWKEFGYRQSGESRGRTMFPFWLFAVTWAFASYAIAAAASWTVPALTMAASVFEPGASDSEMESESEEITPVSEQRRGRGRPRKTVARQGYYVVDPESLEGGIRKYVYYGPSAPPEDA